MPKVVGVAGIGTDNEVTVRTMMWWQIVLVRAGRTYIASVLGFLAADGTGAIEFVPTPAAFGHLGQVAFVALYPTAISLLQNLLEFLTKLDVRRPEWRG